MRTRINTLLLPFIAAGTLASCTPPAAQCPSSNGVALQVLGSGGPIADDGRASSSYLVWVDGVSRVLIDAGGGAFLRFGEAGASFRDLSFVGLSHLHADHSADFPALLKSGNFSGRKRPLNIAGPDTDGQFPGLDDWLQSVLRKDTGAYAYLSGFLDGTGGLPMLVAREVSGDDAVTVYKDDEIQVEAMHVPHGIVPAIAFRINVGGETLVFASDQNGSNQGFAEFANNASVLVMHLVIAEDAEGVARRLHAPPSVVGEIAGKAAPERLVLSHFMARSLDGLEENIGLVHSGYGGEITLAEDLACVAL